MKSRLTGIFDIQSSSRPSVVVDARLNKNAARAFESRFSMLIDPNSQGYTYVDLDINSNILSIPACNEAIATRAEQITRVFTGKPSLEFLEVKLVCSVNLAKLGVMFIRSAQSSTSALIECKSLCRQFILDESSEVVNMIVWQKDLSKISELLADLGMRKISETPVHQSAKFKYAVNSLALIQSFIYQPLMTHFNQYSDEISIMTHVHASGRWNRGDINITFDLTRGGWDNCELFLRDHPEFKCTQMDETDDKSNCLIRSFIIRTSLFSHTLHEIRKSTVTQLEATPSNTLSL